MSNGALVKTSRFKDAVYVGDPANAIRIFNQKEVDELILLDIHATTQSRGIDFETLEKVVSECFMPVCYGGGVRTIEEMRRVYALGVEKISLGAAAFEVPGLVSQASAEFGAQAVVVTLDVKRNILGRATVRTRNGRHDTKIRPIDAAKMFELQGAGELLLYSIDRDGTWTGFDAELIKAVSFSTGIPVIATGGAGSLKDIRAAVIEAGASAVAVGSMAVFQAKNLGVLIKFPSRKDQEAIFGQN
jgi:cyclase